jgi:hypothetical protein
MSGSRVHAEQQIFKCSECGSKYPLWKQMTGRNRGRSYEGHVKDIYCIVCETTTKHELVREYETMKPEVNMDELVKMEWNNERVLTTKQLAECYETDSKVISQNFNRNSSRYQAGTHFYLINTINKAYLQFADSPYQSQNIYLWTEKGALLHAKSLGTDKAWDVFNILMDTYFRVKELAQAKPLSQLEILQQSVALLVEQQKELAEVKESLTTVNHRIDSLDAVNIEGDPQQRLNKMVQKLAHKNGVTYSLAWNQFKDAFNTAYRTNLTYRINAYCATNNLKKVTLPEFLSAFGQLEDGIRVADKLLNL